MADPIRDLFGVSALELFRGNEFRATHGPLERLPAFMHTGPMQSREALCKAYTGPLEVANGEPEDGVQVPIGDVHSSVLLRLGLTVYFRDVRRTLPDSTVFLRELDTALGLYDTSTISVFANAQGSGLPVHHDTHDQLIFQILGQKQLSYARNRYVERPSLQFSPYASAPFGFGPNYRHGFPPTGKALIDEGMEAVTLRPGTALFLPAGLWHTTAEQPEEALSITVTVRAPTRLDLALNALGHYAAQSPAFRTPVYAGFAGDPAAQAEERAAFQRLLADLGARLGTYPAATAFDAFRAHGFATGSIAEYPRAARFERFIRLPSSSVRFEDDAALGKLRCVVSAPSAMRPPLETVLAFHPEARGLVEWILGVNRAFSVEELALAFDEFGREDIDDLLSWLAHAALIRPLLAPEWDAR